MPDVLRRFMSSSGEKDPSCCECDVTRLKFNECEFVNGKQECSESGLLEGVQQSSVLLATAPECYKAEAHLQHVHGSPRAPAGLHLFIRHLASHHLCFIFISSHPMISQQTPAA